MLFIVCRVLGEVSEEMKSKVPLLAKQKKESDFLKQKSGHYQKLVAAMTVHAIVDFILNFTNNNIVYDWSSTCTCMNVLMHILCRRS